MSVSTITAITTTEKHNQLVEVLQVLFEEGKIRSPHKTKFAKEAMNEYLQKHEQNLVL